MAGLFDWLKGKKAPAKVRGRSGTAKRGEAGKRRGAQRRDADLATEFHAIDPPARDISRDETSTGAAARPTPPPAGSQSSPEPRREAPTEPVAAAQTPAPPPAPQPSRSEQPVERPTVDPDATQYHAFAVPEGPTLVGVLIVQGGKSKDTIFKVWDGENVIGRGDGVQIQTDRSDDRISREHALIIHEAGSFGIKPLKVGANPTFVNEAEVTVGAALVDGDLVRVGQTTLKFRVN
jgi:hypothetical protein